VAKIHRFSPEAAVQILMNRAQQVGLPVQMPQVGQGVQQLLGVLYQQGIFLAVDDTSPYFQQLAQRLAGRTQQVRAPAPVPQYPSGAMPGMGVPPNGNGNGNGVFPHQQWPSIPQVQQASAAFYPANPPTFEPMQNTAPQMPGPAVRFSAQPVMPVQPLPPAVQFSGLPPMPPTQNFAPHPVPVAAPVIGGGPAPVAPVARAPQGAPPPPGAVPAPQAAADAPPSLTDMPAPSGSGGPGGSNLDSF